MTKLFRHLQFWLLLATCLWLSLIPQPPGAFAVMSDKVLHLLGYFALHLSGSCAFPARRRQTLLFVLLFSFSLLVELVQHFIPGRQFSLLDLIANGCGLLLGVLAVHLLSKLTAKTWRSR